MPWCPNCKVEYREGYEKCSTCNTILVDEIITEVKSITYDHEVLLMSVTNDMEANIYESLLRAYEIPVLKRPKLTGDYLKAYMGSTNLGIDLYVPSMLLKRAKEVIEYNRSEAENLPNGEEISIKLEKKYKDRQRFRTWIILLFFVPGFIWILIAIIMGLFQYFTR